MDITANRLKTMKAKELRKIVREAINEILAEGEAENKAAEAAALKNHQAQIAAATAAATAADTAKKAADTKKAAVTADKNPGLMENEIEEMARLAKGFRLADPNIDASQFTKRISGIALSDIVNYFRENPGTEKAQLQAQFGFARPQIANAIVNGLLDAGVLVKLSASGEEEAPVAPGEEAPTQATDVEDLFVGSAENPLSMYFDDEPNADGTEDFNAEEEPTAGEVEPGESAATGGMSDEDYDAFMKYSDLKDRLNATKSNLLKMKRSKGGVAGDISDKPSTEEQRLRDLKKSLEDRINTIVAGSDYLKKKLEKETGKPAEEPAVEPEEDETIDESFDREYELRKLKFYAGIIK